MKLNDGWWWPDGEEHIINWMHEPQNRMQLNGRPSYQGRKQLAALAHCTRRRVAVDIGAHVGTWSFNLARFFDAVECFEPVAEHRECFVKNVTTPNAHMHPFALGQREGSVSIWSNPFSSGDSWISGTGDVPMRTLDSFRIADVDFIKVDAEGYEEIILRGARNTIEKSMPTICVEQKRDLVVKFGLSHQGAVSFLRSLGYGVAQEIAADFLMVPA